jgi:hypothetical protein
MLVEVVGWVATAVFVASYFFRRAEILVRVQIAGAMLWVVYGVLMRAPPVIAANLLVAGAAMWKATQASRVHGSGTPSESAGEGSVRAIETERSR